MLYHSFGIVVLSIARPLSWLFTLESHPFGQRVSDSRAFIVHIGEEDYVTVDESVICTRFRLLESTLLIEREDFDDTGAISNTVYVRPISTERGW